MPTIKYEPDPSSDVNRDDAKIIGERIEALKKDHFSEDLGAGYVDKEIVLQDARNPESPLHRFFEWDVTEAARQWNLDQARRLITCYRMVVVEQDQPPIKIRNVHIRTTETPSRFVSVDVAMAKEDYRKQVIDDCKGMISGMMHRLSELEEITPQILAKLEELRALLDEEQNRPEKKKPRKRGE